jgi:hypothetical protein
LSRRRRGGQGNGRVLPAGAWVLLLGAVLTPTARWLNGVRPGWVCMGGGEVSRAAGRVRAPKGPVIAPPFLLRGCVVAAAAAPRVWSMTLVASGARQGARGSVCKRVCVPECANASAGRGCRWSGSCVTVLRGMMRRA